MSAEQTNIERQAKRHTPSLVGMGFAVGIAILLLLVMIYTIFSPAEENPANLITPTQEELS